jgi:hypothetical protein
MVVHRDLMTTLLSNMVGQRDQYYLSTEAAWLVHIDQLNHLLSSMVVF